MAAFTQQQLNKIFELLINHREMSMIEIAKLYNVSSGTIKSINQGKSYIQPDITYPIRTKEESNKFLLTGTKSSSAKIDEIQLKEIINLICNSTKTFAEIARIYNVHPSTIGSINMGKHYHDDKLSYPLRKKEEIKKIQYKKNV